MKEATTLEKLFAKFPSVQEICIGEEIPLNLIHTSGMKRGDKELLNCTPIREMDDEGSHGTFEHVLTFFAVRASGITKLESSFRKTHLVTPHLDNETRAGTIGKQLLKNPENVDCIVAIEREGFNDNELPTSITVYTLDFDWRTCATK